MTIELTRLPNAADDAVSDSVVALQAIGTLEKSDLETLGPQLELQVEQHGTIRLFIELVDFKGMTPGAAWEDVKLAFRHFGDVDRIAVVGENRWEREMTSFAQLFTSAEVRYFDVDSRAEADAWIREPRGAEAAETT